MSNYRRLISYVKPHVKILSAAFLFMVLTSLFQASPLALVIPLVDRIMADKLIVLPEHQALPLFVTDLVDHINALPRLRVLDFLLITAVLVAIFRSLFEYCYTYFMSDASHRVIRDLRGTIYDKLIHLPLSYFSAAKTGTLVSRITYDSGIIRDAISEGLKDLLFQPVQLLSYFVVLFSVRSLFSIPWNFIFVIFCVLPLVIYPIIIIGNRLRKISRQSQERMADIHSSLFESISGIRVVQAFNAEEYESKKFMSHNQGYYVTMMRSIGRTLLTRPMATIVITLCGGVVAWMGGREIIHRGMSPGALTAFLGTLFLLVQPFKRLSRLHSINQTALAAAERIFQVLDEPRTVSDDNNPVYVGGLRNAIEFNNVDFSYEPNAPVLKNINLKINAGDIIALVGPSGTGKTTLLNLLPRFYDPVRGEILIDGLPLKKVKLESLRNLIGIVPQETILFNDFVAANIAYGKTDVSDKDIISAAKAANAHDFISRLPKGYQTVIGDRGFKLSGGEKQRIAIARALIKDAPILILDEATSALDSESEKLVQQALQKLMMGRTVLVIAHRLSTVKNASRILVLEKGDIREQGKHEELLKQNGLYKRIYEMQFQV